MGPLPKRKISRRRRGNRRSHDALVPPHVVRCETCDEYKLAHHVCPSCGHYRDREVYEIKED